jgi:hypothetical protein
MTIFVTKWALTLGIVRYENANVSDESPGDVWLDGKYGMIHFHGNEWHTDYQSAKDDAEKRLARKMFSIEKQLQKLRSMTFDQP